MSTRKDPNGRLCRHLETVVSPLGDDYAIYETPTTVDTVRGEEWEAWERWPDSAFDQAVKAAQDKANREALVAKHGIACRVGRWGARLSQRVSEVTIVRATRTQFVAESGRRFKRHDGKEVGRSIYVRSLHADDLAKVEELAAGRERVDFVAEGEAAVASAEEVEAS